MDGLLVLLGAVVLGIPVAVIYLLVSHAGLRNRIAALEAALAADPVPHDSGRRDPVRPDPGRDDPKAAAGQDTPDAPERPAKTANQPAAARVIAARRAAETEIETEIEAKAQDTSAADVPAPPPPPEPSYLAQTLGRGAAWLAGNWFYAVSALSLALAGLFLVQYGAENGFFPPAARVLGALGFGAALIGAGEWVRRRFGDSPDRASAHIPSVFSGAGLVSLFGGVAAAHLLYGLIGAELAFVGMALVGVLGVALGWLHGPILVTVGVVGAFVAPFLVAGMVPATGWIFLYFAIIAALGLGIDTVRRWAWVSVLSLVLGFGAGWLSVLGAPVALMPGFQMYVLGLAVLAILVPARGLHPDHGGVLVAHWVRIPTGARPGFATALAAGTVIATVLALIYAAAQAGETHAFVAASGAVLPTPVGAEVFWLSVAGLAVLTAAMTYWSARAPALQDIAVLPVVGLVICVALEGVGGGPVLSRFAAAYAETTEAAYPRAVSVLWAIGIALSVLAAMRAGRGGITLGWALCGALIAPVMAIALELTWRPAAVIGAYPWALHAMAMAGVMVALALRFARTETRDRTHVALFVLSALASISFALVLILSSAALTVALAVVVVAAAALDRRFDLALMQVFIVIGVIAVGARLVVDPGLDWALDAPLWEMVLAYGGALAAFLGALWLLGTRVRTSARVMLDTAAWSTGGMFASLVLMRMLNDALPGHHQDAHWAMGLFAVIWLGLMVVQLIRREAIGGRLAWVRAGLAVVFGLVGFVWLGIGLTLASPLLFGWGEDVAGPALLNTLIPAYLLPALVLGLGALRLRGRWVRRGLAAAAIGVGVYWAFGALRHVWQGPEGMQLSTGFSQPELYSYTVALLVVGAGLFYQSLARGAPLLRRAGLVVIGAAVAKVFLIDISDLQGLTRVLSLVVLGLSLAGLAWLNRWAQDRTP